MATGHAGTVVCGKSNKGEMMYKFTIAGIIVGTVAVVLSAGMLVGGNSWLALLTAIAGMGYANLIAEFDDVAFDAETIEDND